MKSFIGKGKKLDRFDIVDVTIDMAKANPHVFTTDNGTFLKFSVALRKEADKFGATHSVSVWTPDQAKAAVAAEPESGKRKRKAKA